jgi:hypothetical protein
MSLVGLALCAVRFGWWKIGIASPPTTGNLTPPELIEADYQHGKITAEKRILYLYYALGKYDKLPPAYKSSVPWGGTLAAGELTDAVASKAIFCKFSSATQQELRAAFPQAAACH